MVEIHAGAQADVDEAFDWYWNQSPAAAERFVAAVERGLAEIESHSEMWPPYILGTRKYRLSPFPYLLVYRSTGVGVQVIAVAHGKRRFGYWRDRL